MKVYIQQVDGKFPDDWIYAAWLGFNKLGAEIFFFEDLQEVPKSKRNIVISYVEETSNYFRNIGVMIPIPINIPYILEKYTKREINYTTMGEFKKNVKTPIFVKPKNRFKGFPSGVIKNESSKKFVFNDVQDSEEILTSSLIEMVTEYRCFVYKQELVGIQWYGGNFEIFPDIQIVKDIINDFKELAPISYTVDVAVTDKNETVLVEIQDFWSLCNYGLEAKIYAKMLRDRWFEIVGRKELELQINDILGKHIREVDDLCNKNHWSFSIRKKDGKILYYAGGAVVRLRNFELTVVKDIVTSAAIG